MAVLTDAIAPADQAALMERVLSDPTLTQSTYYFTYYQLEALRKAGIGDRYIEQLAPWRGMLDLGLTTVPETKEPTRSDSHAWSAHPNYGLLATVLGVRPAEPGFKTVRIAPHLGPLRRAEGRVPHPLGTIDVRLSRTGGDGLHAEITLPNGLAGVFEWKGRKRHCDLVDKAWPSDEIPVLHRQIDHEAGAPRGVLLHPDLAAVVLHDPARDGKA